MEKKKRQKLSGCAYRMIKYKKELNEDGKKCRKISDMFKSGQNSKTNSSNSNFNDSCTNNDESKDNLLKKVELQEIKKIAVNSVVDDSPVHDKPQTLMQEKVELVRSIETVINSDVDDEPKISMQEKVELQKCKETVINSDVDDPPYHDEPQTSVQEDSSKMPVLNKIDVMVNVDAGENDEVRSNLLEHHDYYVRPATNFLASYIKYHPHQPKNNIPFSAGKAYFRKDGGHRMWVTYRSNNPAIFCSLCILYCKLTETNTFINGVTDWKHLYSRIEEHECSNSHRNSVDAYMLKTNHGSVDSLLTYGQRNLRKSQVINQRQVLNRVIDVVKLIGKRGLSYRGKSNEAAYTLINENLDHGNFLEIITLLGKYDSTLKNHLDTVIKKSQKSFDRGSKQGGGNITFLSKTTVNYVIDSITQLIKSKISSEVKNAKMYSVQLDTTQDITTEDQCSVIIRYVHNSSVQERLVGVVKCKSTKGIDFVDMLLKLLNDLNIDPSKCVGNASDGASNMQGKYNGFSAKLSEATTEQVHIWCYAHVLNLVMCDTTNICVTSVTLFGLIQGCAVFFRESHKRMDKWMEKVPKKKLNMIGDTRWWSKDAALSKIFGHFNNPDDSLYVDLVITLEEVISNVQMSPEARFKATGLLDGLCKYEIILSAQIFLRIFEKTTPLSKYLQTKGIDLLKAYSMVEETLDSLELFSRDFEEIKNASQKFVTWANTKLSFNSYTNIIINEHLPASRVKKKKKQFSYEALDDVVTDPLLFFEINTFNVIMDTITNSFKRRFAKHGALCADFSLLDPKHFPVSSRTLSPNALKKVFKMISQFVPTLKLNDLQLELIDFSAKWLNLNKSLKTHYIEMANDSDNESVCYENEECDLNNASHDKNSCINCCFKLILQYNLFSGAYPGLFMCYKLILTLSVTQVSCERSFSKLKLLKNYLRNSLTQDHLESFMLMAMEKDILSSLDSEDIIDVVATKSSLLQKLLLF